MRRQLSICKPVLITDFPVADVAESLQNPLLKNAQHLFLHPSRSFRGLFALSLAVFCYFSIPDLEDVGYSSA